MIFDYFLAEKYTLCISNEILSEYTEIVSNKMGFEVAETLIELLLEQPNVELVTRYFSWNLIKINPDDNKFVDCAISCNASYLVSQDRHFQILKDIVNLIKVDEFIQILKDP